MICSVCKRLFDVKKDIRLVNARNGYMLPEPKHCAACWQVYTVEELATTK